MNLVCVFKTFTLHFHIALFSPEQNGPDPPGDGRTRQPAMAGGEDDAAGCAKKAR